MTMFLIAWSSNFYLKHTIRPSLNCNIQHSDEWLNNTDAAESCTESSLTLLQLQGLTERMSRTISALQILRLIKMQCPKMKKSFKINHQNIPNIE